MRRTLSLRLGLPYYAKGRDTGRMRPEGLELAGEWTTFSFALCRIMQPTADTVWDRKTGAKNSRGTTHLERTPAFERRSASLQSAPAPGSYTSSRCPAAIAAASVLTRR